MKLLALFRKSSSSKAHASAGQSFDGPAIDAHRDYVAPYERKLSLFWWLCFAVSTLLIAVMLKFTLGKTIVPLQDTNITMIATAIVTIVVYASRHFQKSGNAYMFQITLALTFAFCEYESPRVDYRLVALGALIVFMLQNMCIDRIQYRVNKIDKVILRHRTVVCSVLPILGLIAYVYSFQYYPERYNSEAHAGDPAHIATYLLEDDHPLKIALAKANMPRTVDEQGNEVEIVKAISLKDLAPGFINRLLGVFKADESKILANVPIITKLHGDDITGYPIEWVNQLKLFENDSLFKGLVRESKAHTDKLRPDVTEVGYGVTAGEIADAKKYGFLPKEAELPKSMTKEEADEWMEKVTLPTYDAMVCDKIRVPLTIQQRFALLSFCHNTGGGSLDKLASIKDDRINSGNHGCAPVIMRQYVNAGKHTNVPGLVRRRNWEASLYETSLDELEFTYPHGVATTSN
jgi:GH24 family phage-related lysozyme (muramidase)